MYEHRRRWQNILGIVVLGIGIIPPVLIMYVNLATHTQRFSDTASIPRERVAVVFGAGVTSDGRPTRVLAYRLEAAARLYQEGRVSKLLLTGDNSQIEYNEVAVMQRYAETLGVPTADITLDYAGFSTYESCYRAREIFGVQRAILVTQHFHLPRATYTCHQLGIDVVGLGVPYWGEDQWGRYIPPFLTRYTWREWLATLNALWQVHITRPQPTFLGPFEGIT